MPGTLKTAVISLLALASVAWPLTKVYEVVPYGNSIASVPGDPAHGISQTFRNVVDSLTVVSIWVGDKGSGDGYDVVVRDSASGRRIAHRENIVPGRSWYWMACTLRTDIGAKPVRGRRCCSVRPETVSCRWSTEGRRGLTSSILSGSWRLTAKFLERE